MALCEIRCMDALGYIRRLMRQLSAQALTNEAMSPFEALARLQGAAEALVAAGLLERRP